MSSRTKEPVKPQKQHQLNPSKNEDSWCVSDFSLCSSDRIVLSGSKHTTRETFIKVFSFAQFNSNSRPECLYSKDFNRQENPESWRLVSFLDKSSLVTCLGGHVDKISITDDKIVQCKELTIGDASCVSVKDTKIFIGFSKSSSVVVLDCNLHEISTISLNHLQDGWPVDLGVVSDTVLVCSFGCVPRRALSIAEEDGQLLREYTNPRSDDSVPLSLTVSSEADLVAVLWNSPPQLTIHSFSHGHCLVVADVEPAERIRSVEQDKLVMVDEKGELKIFHLGQFFTMENLETTLSCLLSCDDCKKLGDFFGVSFKISDQTNVSDSPSERVDDDESSVAHRLNFFKCLEDKKKIIAGNVSDLMRACTQLEKERTLLSPLEAYEKYGGDCESRNTCNDELCGSSPDTDDHVVEDSGRDENRRDDDSHRKRRHSRDEPALLTNGFAKRKRIHMDPTPEADDEPTTTNGINQLGLAETIRRAVKEAVDPLLTEIQSLKQQSDLMMCYLRTQPLQNSSSHHCSCFHQCRPAFAQPCSQLHTHAYSHVTPPACSNFPMQCGNGVSPYSQPNLPQQQQSQQQMLVPLPPQQSIAPPQQVVPPPQVVPCAQPLVPLQPYRQPLPHSTQVQMLPYYPVNQHLTFPLPDPRQASTIAVSSTQTSSQQTLHPPNTIIQTPVQAHTGTSSFNHTQVYHTPNQNGATNPFNGFGSPPIQPSTNGPLQCNIQGTPTQQTSLVTPDSSRLSTDPPQHGTPPSITSAPIPVVNEGEEPSVPVDSRESDPPSGQEDSLPTELSHLPKSVQLKLIPHKGQRNVQDRQNVTKVLLKYFFSHDERLIGNTSGRYGYSQLRGDKLYGMRDLIFKICPLDGENNEPEREKEWRELCKLIDVNNRRYRNEIKTGKLKRR